MHRNGKAEKKREAGFELLRLIAMLMVVCMHYFSHTGVLPEWQGSAGGVQIAAQLMESFCLVAVNVYVLLSGYFLSASSFRLERLLRLLGQILFYTLLIPPVLVLAGAVPASEAFNVYTLFSCLFPVESGHYWFVTAYVILWLFTPVLNAAVKNMGRRQHKGVLILLALFFTIGKSFSILQFASDSFGYDFGWFLFLYLTAVYLRKYGIGFLGSFRKGIAFYAAFALLDAALVLLCLGAGKKFGFLEYYFSVPNHYNFLPVFLASLGLFAAFTFVRIKEGKFARAVRFLAPSAFGVYLIHEHVLVSDRWSGWLGSLLGNGAGLMQTAQETMLPSLAVWFFWMAARVIVLFVGCLLIDLLRRVLFVLAENALKRTGAGRWLSEKIKQVNIWMNEWEDSGKA